MKLESWIQIAVGIVGVVSKFDGSGSRPTRLESQSQAFLTPIVEEIDLKRGPGRMPRCREQRQTISGNGEQLELNSSFQTTSRSNQDDEARLGS